MISRPRGQGWAGPALCRKPLHARAAYARFVGSLALGIRWESRLRAMPRPRHAPAGEFVPAGGQPFAKRDGLPDR